MSRLMSGKSGRFVAKRLGAAEDADERRRAVGEETSGSGASPTGSRRGGQGRAPEDRATTATAYPSRCFHETAMLRRMRGNAHFSISNSMNSWPALAWSPKYTSCLLSHRRCPITPSRFLPNDQVTSPKVSYSILMARDVFFFCFMAWFCGDGTAEAVGGAKPRGP